MSRSEIERYGKQLLLKANVVGFAKTLQPRRRKDKVYPDELCLQIHVTEKIPLKKLSKFDVIPLSVGDIPVDVVEYGILKIPLPPIKAKTLKKTEKHRPLVHGISIGNENITAGTNGHLVKGPKSEIYEATNAHVVVEDVTLLPEEVVAKRIAQPGPYDLANSIEECLAGEYIWHKKLYPVGADSNCPVGKAWSGIYNFFAALLEVKTRLKPILQQVNHIDFGIWKPSVEYLDAFFEPDFKPDVYVGQGFAGSDLVSLICKAPYIADEGYEPLDKPYAKEVEVGTLIHKSGRTSCHTSAPLINKSAYELVSYGAFYVAFDDVYVTNKLLEPGDSGSSCWVLES